MITCMGLVVGAVESAVTREVLKQCVQFLKSHRYLITGQAEFEIDGNFYAIVVDTIEDNNNLWVMFLMHDGYTKTCVA